MRLAADGRLRFDRNPARRSGQRWTACTSTAITTTAAHRSRLARSGSSRRHSGAASLAMARCPFEPVTLSWYDRMGMALVNTFDQVGAFGLSTSITNQLDATSVQPAVAPCVRWTGPSDTAAASNNVLSNGTRNWRPRPGPVSPPAPPWSSLHGLEWFGRHTRIRSPRALTRSTCQSVASFGADTQWSGPCRPARPGDSPLLRDFATAADVCDPRSGVCAFEAARELVRLSDADQPLATLAPIPFWGENMFPEWGPSGNNGGCLQFGSWAVAVASPPLRSPTTT